MTSVTHLTPEIMTRTVFIVQGEGMGHMSQAMAAAGIMEPAGYRIERVLVGSSDPEKLPVHFRDAFSDRISFFRSPGFIRTHDRKGILVNRTLLRNLFRIPVYLKESRRIRKELAALEPELVLNFYDVVGALALRNQRSGRGGILRIGVGHHFLLHLENYPCGEGSSRWHRWLLSLHTRTVMRGCDRILALSFRDGEQQGRIRIIPPLIREPFRSLRYRKGTRLLAYLHAEGYLYDLVRIVRKDPSLGVDVFMAGSPRMELPEQIRLFGPDQELFREKLAGCRGLVATAGFDLAAEASFLGVPLVMVPMKNHYEQQCNAADMERNGLGKTAEMLTGETMDLLAEPENTAYRDWVNRAGELLLNNIMQSADV